jgi:hypothetical protein
MRAERRSAQPIALGRRAARVARIDGRSVAAEVLKNPLDRGWFLDARDHPQLPTTASASLDVDGKDTLEALPPRQSTWPVGSRWLARLPGLFGCGIRFLQAPVPHHSPNERLVCTCARTFCRIQRV